MPPSDPLQASVPVPAQAGDQGDWRARFRTYLVWAGLVGLVFFSVYPSMNWLSGLRAHQYSLFICQEVQLPFVPEFIWLYLSMYGLFALPPFFLAPADMRRLGRELILATLLAGVIFLLFPARLGFERMLPEDSLHRALFESLFALDRPFNLVPSLHVVYSTAIILALCDRLDRGARALLLVWLVAVMVSTILVHQHHLLDVVSGWGLALLMRSFWKGKHA